MLIDRLEAHEGDFAEQFPMPNGWVASVIRKQRLTDVPPEIQRLIDQREDLREAMSEANRSYGVEMGLFEMALINPLTNRITNVEGHMAPVDVARKLREWFELPPARGFRDASED